jgi:hypothetical protein
MKEKDIPDEVLELPPLPQPSNLEDKQTVVGQQLVHLCEECRVATNTDVLQFFFCFKITISEKY